MNFNFTNAGHSPLQYRLEDLQVFFSGERCLKIIELILDKNGNINKFPGFIEDEGWLSKKELIFLQM